MTEDKTAEHLLLSVLIGMPADNFDAVSNVIGTFAAQSIADRIEVIVLKGFRAPIRLPAERWAQLASVRFVEVDPFETFPDGIVQGIDQARAGIIVLFEDHAFVGAGWGEAVVRAHGQGFAGVASAMENANPRTGLSWVHILNDLGQYLHGEPPGEKPDLPAHNTSYLRETLTGYSRDELSHLLSMYALNNHLRRKGHRLYLTGDAVCYHQNPSKWPTSLWLRYSVHRLRAGTRARVDGWSLARRLAYVLLTPLIPFVRISDVVRKNRRQKRRDLLRPRIAVAVGFFAFVNAFGELVGLLLGPGDTDAIGRVEFRRHRQMCAADLKAPVPGAASRTATTVKAA